jgi:hypothetical protein
MRLITVSKNNSESTNIVEANFNEDILIKPKSQIAVQHCMFQYHFTGFSVHKDINDTIFIRYITDKSQDDRTVIIPEGQYNNATIFFDMLTRYINSTLDSYSVTDTLFNLDTGVKWQCGFGNNKNVEFGFTSTGGNIADIEWDGTGKNITQTVNGGNTTYTPTVAPVNRDDTYIVSDEYFINGCGVMECQVEIDDCDFAIGLTQTQYKYVSEDLIPEDESIFGVTTDVDGGATRYYKYVLRYKEREWVLDKNGNKVPVLAKDVVDIVSQGDLYGNFLFYIRIYRNSRANLTTDYVVNYSSNLSPKYYWKDYYFGYISLRNPTASISYVAWNKDPYKTPYNSLTQSNAPTQSIEATRQQIVLSFEPELGKQLGFTKQLYSSINMSQTFRAEQPFKYHIITRPFKIEAMNLPIISYDGDEKKRSPIIATIPKLNAKDEEFIQYEPNQLYFVNLNNEYPFQLRDIELRVVDTADTLFSLSEGSSFTLLIKDEDDSPK